MLQQENDTKLKSELVLKLISDANIKLKNNPNIIPD